MMRVFKKTFGLKGMMSAFVIASAIQGQAAQMTEETGHEAVLHHRAMREQNAAHVVKGHQTREIELRVTPEVWAHHPRYCHGHWQQPWGMHHYYCYPGCRGGETYVAQPKRVDVIRDVWKGCEELEEYILLNQAERIAEEPIISHETRMIEGVPITKEIWERTVIYALKEEAFHSYSAQHAVI